MSLLLASYGWILDVVFFTALIAGFAIGTFAGFVRGICKIAGTVLSIMFAAFFCTPFTGALENMFGLVSKLGESIGNNAAAYWLCVIGSFLVLTALTRIAVFLIEKLGKAIVDTSDSLTRVDRLLGGILGLSEAILVIMMIMAIFKWMQVDAFNAFIAESKVVSAIYFGGWFEWLASLPAQFIEGGKTAASRLIPI